MGRLKNRSTLIAERGDLVLEGIRSGLSKRDAARLAGIEIATFYRWCARGAEAKSGMYREFCDAMEEAQADGKSMLLKRIRDAAFMPQEKVRHSKRIAPDGSEQLEVVVERVPPCWRPAAWILERRFPDEFGRSVVQHEGRGGAAVSINMVFDDGESEREKNSKAL